MNVPPFTFNTAADVGAGVKFAPNVQVKLFKSSVPLVNANTPPAVWVTLLVIS